jgi:hypothetical protein
MILANGPVLREDLTSAPLTPLNRVAPSFLLFFMSPRSFNTTKPIVWLEKLRKWSEGNGREMARIAKMASSHGERSEEKSGLEILIQPSLAEPLITAIETGNWGITNLALKNLREYYSKELKYNEESTLKFLRTAYLIDQKTIYEYTCHGGYFEIVQQLNRLHLSPENDEMKIKECNQILISKVQTSDDNETSLSVKQLLCTTREMMILRDKHTLTAQYYHVRHQYLFFLPASILTATSAALAFVTSSMNHHPSLQNILMIIVGIIATVSTFIQTLSDQLGYSRKAELHKTAAISLDSILFSLHFVAIDSKKKRGTAFGPQQLTIIRKQAISIETSCSDPVPEFINSIFDLIMNEITLHLLEIKTMKCHGSEEHGQVSIQGNGYENNDEIIDLQRRLVISINHEFIMSWGWPWYVNKTHILKNIQEQIRRQFLMIATSDSRKDQHSGRVSLYDVIKLYFKNKVIPIIQEEEDDG